MFEGGQAGLQRLQLVAGERRHVRVAGLQHLLQLRRLGPGAGQGLGGGGHRAQFGVLLGQAHDLGPVRGRAHAGLDLAEAVEHLFESRLG